MANKSSKHSVLLKEEECEGCTNCVKNCPTKAIRVHQGKATIKEDLCIDCAECIRTCEYHAKYTETDKLTIINNYSYPVALIPPSFYGQFDEDVDPVKIKLGLKNLGFKQIKDVAFAAEVISRKTADFLKNNQGLFISSSCPVIVRLIKISYPELLDYLIQFKSPVEMMAQKIRNEFKSENNNKIKPGLFFITPCPAKLTTVNNVPGMEKSFLDGALAVDKIYEKLLSSMKEITDKELNNFKNSKLSYPGISWGQSGGEISVLQNIQEISTLSVEGISAVKSVLDEIVRDNLKGIRYLEMVACPEGCVGGVLNVNNPFQAKHNIKQLISKQQDKMIVKDDSKFSGKLDFKFKADQVGKLDQNIDKAVEKFTRLEQEKEILPGLDCASCGAPDCETLAEDIVNGKAQRTDCIFMLRKEIEDMAHQISSLTQELPPVMSRNQDEEGENNES